MRFNIVAVSFLLFTSSFAVDPPKGLQLHTRARTEILKGSGQYQVVEKAVDWDPKKTAIVICDMWDKHWCKGATARVAEMAPRMNEVIRRARQQGVFIIHAPSSTMEFYKDTPQRKLAQAAPKAQPKVALKAWCRLDPSREAALPIDDSDGGCDDHPQCAQASPWKRQIATIEIAEGDAITDSDEAYNLLQERSIENVIVMGVHVNMCVLGRPFSIRQMIYQGKNVVLMRDLTDSMYNSRMPPQVSHFRGNELVIEHIEKFWCASITSADFLAGDPFHFKDDKRPQNTQKQSAPLSPAVSLNQFKIAEDLEIEQLLAEPVVRQPVFLNFDERGRMWVVQYLQYPDPAGLKLLSKDNVWRAVYDKIPPPPPRHFIGQDKITIHEDTDGDGVFDKRKTFLEGLNIVTAVTKGRGGAWVMNPPYLLFYPDKNNDDLPDGDPEVHLAGFGLEDTHSVANSLRWGPDGWLYAAQGSTVTGTIVRPGIDKEPRHSMGQLIWRYHPETKRYEVFAEGGGNAFGCEIDPKGRVFSGHNGGNTRGFHYAQGGYLQKGFEKHGPLSNPYAFGFFPPMPHANVERFTHNFVIYDGGALPARYDGKLFGVEPLQGRVVESEIQPDRSSFKTKDLSHPVATSDSWFRPVDIKVGPDGALYIADWYDEQVNHYRNHEGKIDRGSGRIYRLKAKGAKPIPPFDLSKLATAQLVELLNHKNEWQRQTALRLIGDRKDRSVIPILTASIASGAGQPALEAFWALNLSGGFDDDVARKTLEHKDPFVRLWTIRLLGDANRVSSPISRQLEHLAGNEPHLEVRSQLASTARRLPAKEGLAIVRNLMAHDEDASDNRIPLLLWWAIESKADSDRESVVKLFEDPALWKFPLVQQHLLDRIMRRYAQAGTRKDLLTCARLLQLSPEGEQASKLMAGFEAAFKGRSMPNLPDELIDALAKHGGESLVLSLRQGQAEAIGKALQVITDEKSEPSRRQQYIQILGEVKQPASVPALLRVVRESPDSVLRKTALTALQQYEDPNIGTEIIAIYNSLTNDVQTAARTLLASRSTWSLQLLKAVDACQIKPDAIPRDVVRQIELHQNPELAKLVNKHWGRTRNPTDAEMKEKIHHLAEAIQAGSGDPYTGQKMFSASCAACHKLFGQGGQVGPDLTTYKRDDLDTMLLSIINPNVEIREGYENYVVNTKDDRTLTGFLVEKDNRVLVMRGLDGQNIVLDQKEIQEMNPAGMSLMPEGLLDTFDEKQIRDLFAYLRSTQPLVK